MKLEKPTDGEYWQVQIIIKHYWLLNSTKPTTSGFCSGPRFDNLDEATEEMMRLYELSKWDDD